MGTFMNRGNLTLPYLTHLIYIVKSVATERIDTRVFRSLSKSGSGFLYNATNWVGGWVGRRRWRNTDTDTDFNMDMNVVSRWRKDG